MKTRVGILTASVLFFCGVLAQAETWPMKQKDQGHTGRAGYTVPLSRMNSSFFDIFLWQKPAPNSPSEGHLGGTSMTFHDAAGPHAADIVVGTYHWPKGICGMDRHTGKTFWSGNPNGGETLGEITPAFSPNGQTLYVINDATDPYGPLMAFATLDGPSAYRSNSAMAHPDHFQLGSPVICHNDQRIFSSQWCGKVYAASDNGSQISEVWAAPNSSGACTSEPSLWSNAENGEVIVATGRDGILRAFDDFENELWSVSLPQGTDATPTVDPMSGNIYVAIGWDDIHIVGLNVNGNPLWSDPAMMVFDWEEGVNSPQHASGAGCLSHDGATYYFQTVASDGTGKLYAINTVNGSVKWSYDTQSKGWEGIYSCPVVTANGVIVVGNNENGTFFALKDHGPSSVTLLDTFTVQANPYSETIARASATLSTDGLLYLPLRTFWVAGNGDGQTPNYTTQNLFSALDLTEDAQVILYPPGKQRAIAGNHSVRLKWTTIQDLSGTFAHYAIYRGTTAFTTVEGMTPIATLSSISTNNYIDNTAINGTSYFYAVTTVSTSGSEIKTIASVGPRTPRNETDLQVVSITRTPFYPRFCVDYTGTLVTEESGFGPYWFSAATGFCDGQNEFTKRGPDLNESMTYTAKIRNRGTNIFSDTVGIRWEVDGAVVAELDITLNLASGQMEGTQLVLPWDNESHDMQFTLLVNDARPQNNTLKSDTLAVGFLTYVDESFIEKFREEWTGNWPHPQTDDIIDWLNMHMDRFNELFADANCQKRVHYDVLEVLDDLAVDPAAPAPIHFAIFPFRYHWDTDGDPRLSGYYHQDDDIDYGLLHEMGHQLGMIDVYQLDLGGDQNQVNGQGYSAHDDLMRGCSPFIAPFHARAMNHWLKQPHGYYGQYLYNLPSTIQLRLLGQDGQPLNGATVKMYQMCERDSQGKIITNQMKAQGTTNAQGLFTLPNVPINPSLVPPVGTGDTLHNNPFGYVHVVGTNGVLLFRVEYESGIDYCWLDITECCTAYWNGQTETAVFDRPLVLGGSLMRIMPKDLAEGTAYDWAAWAEGATASVSDDTTNTQAGNASVKFTTNGGFDTYLRYPKTYTALWDLADATQLHLWFYAENPHGFQNESPWIRLKDANGNYFEYTYYEDGNRADFLNLANYQWREAVIPLEGPFVENGWNRAEHGTPDLRQIQMVEIHADTWDYGFDLWVDDVRFDWPESKYCNFQTDAIVNTADLAIMANHWLNQNCQFAPSQGADLNQDKKVDLVDFAIFTQSWLEETGYTVAGDTNNDGRVDLEDFALFTNQWLATNCSTPNHWCQNADIDRSGSVAIEDLAQLVENWLIDCQENPSDPACNF